MRFGVCRIAGPPAGRSRQDVTRSRVKGHTDDALLRRLQNAGNARDRGPARPVGVAVFISRMDARRRRGEGRSAESVGGSAATVRGGDWIAADRRQKRIRLDDLLKHVIHIGDDVAIGVLRAQHISLFVIGEGRISRSARGTTAIDLDGFVTSGDRTEITCFDSACLIGDSRHVFATDPPRLADDDRGGTEREQIDAVGMTLDDLAGPIPDGRDRIVRAVDVAAMLVRSPGSERRVDTNEAFAGIDITPVDVRPSGNVNGGNAMCRGVGGEQQRPVRVRIRDRSRQVVIPADRNLPAGGDFAVRDQPSVAGENSLDLLLRIGEDPGSVGCGKDMCLVLCRRRGNLNKRAGHLAEYILLPVLGHDIQVPILKIVHREPREGLEQGRPSGSERTDILRL